MNLDRWIYVPHVIFWATIPLTRLLTRSRREAPISPNRIATATGTPTKTAPLSRTLIFFHMVGIGVTYFGINEKVIPNQVPSLFAYQRAAGLALILLANLLVTRSLLAFRSWRFRAQLDAGHELVTSGPYRMMRHPIYMGMNLLALGSALWVPTVTVAIGFALVTIGSDLRGRAEEKLLVAAFGDQYRSYMKRVKRFIPGIY